jgi:transcriptional regulator with XRE-family HTH domain
MATAIISDEEAKARLAKNVRRLLSERGWKGSDLARATRENEVRVSNLLRAQTVASGAFVARVAEALEVSIDCLFAPSRKNFGKSA